MLNGRIAYFPSKLCQAVTLLLSECAIFSTQNVTLIPHDQWLPAMCFSDRFLLVLLGSARAFHRAISDPSGSMPLCWLSFPVPPQFSIPEIFTYQQIPQYHQTYNLYYKIGTGAHKSKTEFQKDWLGGREEMEEPAGLFLQFSEPLPWPWSGPSKILNGSPLGLEDNLRRVKISSIKSMNIKGPGL